MFFFVAEWADTVVKMCVLYWDSGKGPAVRKTNKQTKESQDLAVTFIPGLK